MTTTTLQKKRKPSQGTGLLWLLTPVWALLIALGAIQSAKAQQVSFSSDAIGLTLKTTTGTVQSVNYAGKANTNASPYNSYPKMGTGSNSTTNLGTFDLVNTSQLTLTGGSLVLRALTDDDGNPYAVTGAGVRYRVYLKSTTATLPNYTTVAFPTSAAYTPPTGGMQYSGSANANLLNGLNTGGNYVLEVQFIASTANADTNPSDADPSTTTYQIGFTVTAPPAPTLTGTSVYLTPNTGSDAGNRLTYGVHSTFPGANLGNTTYNIVSGQLILNGGVAISTESVPGANAVNSVTMYYRVHPQNQATGGFSFINLTQVGSVSSNGTRTFSNTTNTTNLINSGSIVSAGDYNLDIWFQASGTNTSDPANPTSFTLNDGSSTNYYSANFTVVGDPVPATIWRGGKNDNWFDDANWTNSVPTANTNVIIQNIGNGSSNPYPRILCNTSYIYKPANGQPVLIDNTGKMSAEARGLSMEGNSASDKSQLSLVQGTLNVRGDFANQYNSFFVSENTTVGFIGGDQTIYGGTFASVTIDGGGNKSLQATMSVGENLNFNSGLLVTDASQPLTSIVHLADRSNNNPTGGQLLGENNVSYLRGLVDISHRNVAATTEDLFGNIGLALKFVTSPGQIVITRNTAQAYNPGNGAASGVRRIFDVTQPTANAGVVVQADMRFFYLDNETQGLGSNGNINIDENNLVVFVTTNKGNTFTNLGSSANDTGNNIVTLNGTTSFAVPTTTFTLGDKTNPLPVELVAFDAKRSGANTLVAWQTASEKNNAGFDVEVAVDGVKFRKLAFVASHSANSTTAATYSYTDTEAGKSGVRYYRLRQVDLDGQYSYSPIRAVSFAGATGAAVASLSSYPSPFTSSDQAALVLQAPTAGTAQLQLMDLMGRTIVSRAVTTVAGISEVAVPNARELAAGTYLVKVTFATGEVKTLRIQKH
ncbi:MAG: T9SS type A sorting domain-containing protein [Hymenobacter sp.]|nr:MAG: T9SS type A sorting domain-containing protein [Hymenobacter sp.]